MFIVCHCGNRYWVTVNVEGQRGGGDRGSKGGAGVFLSFLNLEQDSNGLRRDVLKGRLEGVRVTTLPPCPAWPSSPLSPQSPRPFESAHRNRMFLLPRGKARWELGEYIREGFGRFEEAQRPRLPNQRSSTFLVHVCDAGMSATLASFRPNIPGRKAFVQDVSLEGPKIITEKLKKPLLP
jgi:hypothetical protein